MSTNRGILIVVSGPAGSGKGSVLAKVFEQSKDFVYSVSSTTRAPRPGEIDGVHYNFVSRDEFEKLIDTCAMVEYTVYCGNYYGTSKSVIEKDLENGKNVILEIEVDGAMQIKTKFPDAVLILIIPKNFKILEARLRGRGTNTEADIQNRLERSREELKFYNRYDYVIINEDNALELAAQQFMGIVASEKLSAKRNSDLYDKFFNNN